MSRWTNAASNQATYESFESQADPRLRQADSIRFDPRDMISGTSVGMYGADHSQQRVDAVRMQPIYLYVGAALAFVLVLNYLRSTGK